MALAWPIYPEALPNKDWLSHYSKTLKTIKLNVSFSSWPTLANVESWKKQVGQKIFFAP